MKPHATIPPEMLGSPAGVIAAALGISRQHVYKLKRKLAGCCINCGSISDSGNRCSRCAEKHRKNVRKKSGHKPWQPGKPGRPPKERK